MLVYRRSALTMTLAGRVGTGNIAGVATAITFGGPGALFWMWIVAFWGQLCVCGIYVGPFIKKN